MDNWIIYLALIAVALRGAFGRPEWAVLAAVFFAPLTQALPSPLGPISASANILILALLLAWLRKDRREHRPTPLARLMLVMALFILIGYLHRVHLELVEGRVFRNTLENVTGETKEWLMAYVAYFLAFPLIDSTRLLIRVWGAALLSAGLEGMLSLYERMMGIGRATAHLEEPNRAGAYFAAMTVMFLAAALLKGGRMRLLAIAGLVLCLGGVFASLSRGAMLGLTLGALLVLASFFLFVEKGASKWVVAVLGVLVLLNASLVVPERVVERVRMTFGGESPTSVAEDNLDQSADERLELWRAALRIMSDRPLGIGFHTFSTEVGNYLTKYTYMSKVAHNIYLQVGAELGVPALVALVLLLLNVIRRCWRVFRSARDTDETAIALGLTGSWLALAVAMFFINPLFAFNLSGQFWLLTASTLAASAAERARPSEDVEASRAAPAHRAIGRARRRIDTRVR